MKLLRKRTVHSLFKGHPLEGRHTFLGNTCMQTPSAMMMLETVLTDNSDIKRVVELGTGTGGLTMFFGLHMAMRGGKVLTFDHSDRLNPTWRKWAKIANITFRQKEAYAQNTIEEVEQFIKDERALIFCDLCKRNKAEEIRVYKKIMKKDDLIMAKAWNEKNLAQIATARYERGLELHRQEEFDQLKTYLICLIKA